MLAYDLTFLLIINIGFMDGFSIRFQDGYKSACVIIPPLALPVPFSGVQTCKGMCGWLREGKVLMLVLTSQTSQTPA